MSKAAVKKVPHGLNSRKKDGKIDLEKLAKVELENLLNHEMRIIETHVDLIKTVCETLLSAAKDVRKRMGMEAGAA